MTHKINANKTAAVATDYYWIPINADTPRGVKVQLLGAGGVAAYGFLGSKPDRFWTHWAPLPRKPE